MSASRSNKSLKNLMRLYEHRKSIAEAKVEEQKGIVQQSRVELVEREGKVAKLEQEIQENVEFLKSAGENVSAAVLHAANRHRYWTDYDKQKEDYYLDLTRQELKEHTSELQKRRVSLTKLEAKTDVVDSLVSKNNAEIDRRQETDLEDEFDAIYAARRGGAHG